MQTRQNPSKEAQTMKDSNHSEKEPRYMPIGMCLGMSLGTAIGVAADNLSTCMCIGLALGMCIGTLMDRKHQKDSPDRKNQ